MSMAASIAGMRANIAANQAELAIIRGNQAQQNLAGLGPNTNLNDVARKEAQIEAQKEAAKTKAQAAYAQQKAMKNGNKHKINYLV